MNNVIYRPEGKAILDAFNELLPWEKGEIIKQLAENEMSWYEIEKYFIEGSGYVKYDDLDLVKEIFNNDLEDEVMDEMDDWTIIEYLSHSWHAFENARDLFKEVDAEDQAKILDDMYDSDLENMLEEIEVKHPDLAEKIHNHLCKNIDIWKKKI